MSAAGPRPQEVAGVCVWQLGSWAPKVCSLGQEEKFPRPVVSPKARRAREGTRALDLFALSPADMQVQVLDAFRSQNMICIIILHLDLLTRARNFARARP